MTMKLSPNDWSFSGDISDFDWNIEENKEYPINAWITAENENSVYLVSAYAYDEFVMFFFVYKQSSNSGYVGQDVFEQPKTNYNLIADPTRGHYDFPNFEIKVNHLDIKKGSGNGYFPLPKIDEYYDAENNHDFDVAEEEFESKLNKSMDMLAGGYDYLHNLVEGRLPKQLQGEEIVFWKQCFSYVEPVKEINHIAIYPEKYKRNRHFIDKTFTIPLGDCDIKVPYSMGEEKSYFIVRELKVFDMLEYFNENYDKFKEVHENSLREWEQNGKPQNQSIIELDDIRKIYDKKLLMITYLKPEESHSFELYLTNYLNAVSHHIEGRPNLNFENEIEADKATFIPQNTLAPVSFIIIPDEDDNIINGLFKSITALCEAPDKPNSEYEITLMWIHDSIERECKALFVAEFSSFDIP